LVVGKNGLILIHVLSQVYQVSSFGLA